MVLKKTPAFCDAGGPVWGGNAIIADRLLKLGAAQSKTRVTIRGPSSCFAIRLQIALVFSQQGREAEIVMQRHLRRISDK